MFKEKIFVIKDLYLPFFDGFAEKAGDGFT